MPEQKNVNINTDQNDYPPQYPYGDEAFVDPSDYDEIPPQNPFDDVAQEDIDDIEEPASFSEQEQSEEPEPASQPELDSEPSLAEENHQKALAAARSAIEREKDLFNKYGTEKDVHEFGYSDDFFKNSSLRITVMENSLSGVVRGAASFLDHNSNMGAASFRGAAEFTRRDGLMSGGYGSEPLYGVYKVNSIYNNHPYHLVFQHDHANNDRDPLLNFFRDFDDAISKGRGIEFLKNPDLQFGFYDNTPIESIDPKALLGVMAMQAKLDMAHSLNDKILATKISDPYTKTMPTKRLRKYVSDYLHLESQNLASTDKPFDVFRESRSYDGNPNYLVSDEDVENFIDKLSEKEALERTAREKEAFERVVKRVASEMASDNQPQPISNEEQHEKALAAAHTAILEDEASYNVSSDMIVGSLGSRTEFRPGRLTISVLEGSAEISAESNELSFSENRFVNLFTSSLHSESLMNSEIEFEENAKPAYAVYKVDGIYNNHPFHLVIEQDIAHQKGDVLQTFFDDFDKAISEGRGKDFLKNPALQFGFYDKTSVKSIDPQAFLGVMVMQAKLDMVESLNLPNTISMEPSVLLGADALQAHVKSIREKLATTDKPFELFSEPGLSNISKNYVPDSKEMKNLLVKAETSNKKITLAQKKFICQHMARLAPAYQKYFTGLSSGAEENSVPFNLASDAIRGMVAREQLKNYLPKLDPRRKSMDTQEAEKLVAEFKDKPTLQQKAFIERYVPEAEMEKLSFAKAKTTMLGAKVTDKLKKLGSRFAEIKDSFSCGQVLNIIKGGMEKAFTNTKELVAPVIARHVAKFKTDVKENSGEYNMAQWQKDCMSVPPFEAQKAFVDWHELQDKVKEDTFSKNFPQNSCALYSKVISNYLSNIAEKSKSPSNEKQQAFLRARNTKEPESLNYSMAHMCIADSLYADGIVSKNVAVYIANDLSIEIPDKYLSSVVDDKPLSAEDKKNLGQTLKEACIDREKLMRSYQIHNSLFTTPRALRGIAQSVAANFYEENKTFDGAEKEIAKVLICVDISKLPGAIGKIQSRSIARALGKSEDSVTKAEIIADTMTRVLPNSTNYKESFKRNLELVKNAQLGLSNEVRKVEIKNEVGTQNKQNFKNRQNGGINDD